MTDTPATEITVTCLHCGHSWETRAKRGSSAQCRECKATRKIGLKDRPIRSAKTSAWDSEPLFDGNMNLAETEERDDEDVCDTCGKPLYWELARTMLYCIGCKRWYMSCSIKQYYNETRVTEIQTKSTERKDRVDLKRETQTFHEECANLADQFESKIDEYELDNKLNIRVTGMRATIVAYLTEILNAKSQYELQEIHTEIRDDVIGKINELIKDVHEYNEYLNGVDDYIYANRPGDNVLNRMLAQPKAITSGKKWKQCTCQFDTNDPDNYYQQTSNGKAWCINGCQLEINNG